MPTIACTNDSTWLDDSLSIIDEHTIRQEGGDDGRDQHDSLVDDWDSLPAADSVLT